MTFQLSRVPKHPCRSPTHTNFPLNSRIGEPGWTLVGGTSVSSPLIAGTMALANAYTRSFPGAEALYEDAVQNGTGALDDVTSGSNVKRGQKSCGSYLCIAGPGYDGPTGLGTPYGAPVVLPNSPTVVTKAASSVTQTSATLNATVNPNSGEVSECKLEYGTAASYGSSAPCSLLPGSGNSAIAVSAAVAGLTPDTTYHVRISATNAGGTSKGSDETFNTLTTPSLTASFTREEANGRPFGEPTAIAVGPSGNIFVADGSRFHDRILEFNSKHEYVRQFGSAGSAEGQFNQIGGIAINAFGNLYVSDSGNNRVEEFNAEGTCIGQFGSFGSGNGQFDYPTGVAIDASGDVWVLDASNYRVQEFSSTGGYLSSFGSRGTGIGALGWASGLALSRGNVYLAESENNRVQEFSSSGAYVRQFDEQGSGEGKSNAPLAIANDPSTGNLFVVEGASILAGAEANRVQEFSPEGVFVAAFGSSGLGAGQLAGPRGGAVSSWGAIFIADSGNQRIEEWAP